VRVLINQPTSIRLPRCGHMQSVPCSVSAFDFKCEADCDQKLSCGHRCQNKCGESHTKQCGYAFNTSCSIGHKSLIK